MEIDSLTNIIMPPKSVQMTIIGDESRMTRESEVSRAWIAPGVKLSKYRIHLRSFRNATDYESKAVMGFLTTSLQDELDGIGASSGEQVDAIGLVYWAEEDRDKRRGVGIEMVFRDSSGKIIAELRHRIYESSPEAAAEEMVEAVTDFIEDHRVR